MHGGLKSALGAINSLPGHVAFWGWTILEAIALGLLAHSQKQKHSLPEFPDFILLGESMLDGE